MKLPRWMIVLFNPDSGFGRLSGRGNYVIDGSMLFTPEAEAPDRWARYHREHAVAVRWNDRRQRQGHVPPCFLEGGGVPGKWQRYIDEDIRAALGDDD